MTRVERDKTKKRIGPIELRQTYHTKRTRTRWVGSSIALVLFGATRAIVRWKSPDAWHFGVSVYLWPAPVRVSVFFGRWVLEALGGGMAGRKRAEEGA